MPIADLGYQPYSGKRLPTGRNHWVITAMEIRRIWASPLVKITVVIAVLWGMLQVLYLLGSGYLVARLSGVTGSPVQADAAAQALAQRLTPEAVLSDIDGQMFFAVLISLAWGAGAIANDVKSRSLQFYFAKPVTERLYLLGKIIPLTIVCFVLCVFPAILDSLVEGFLLRGQGLMASRFALILPSILYAVVVSVFMATVSIGISSISSNRLLTLAYWAALLFVPLAVALIADLATSGAFQWLYLASPITMLRELGRFIFRLESGGPAQWYHAFVIISGLCFGAVWIAWQRLSKAEVIG